MVGAIEVDESSIHVEFHEVVSGQLRFLGLSFALRFFGLLPLAPPRFCRRHFVKAAVPRLDAQRDLLDCRNQIAT